MRRLIFALDERSETCYLRSFLPHGTHRLGWRARVCVVPGLGARRALEARVRVWMRA